MNSNDRVQFSYPDLETLTRTQTVVDLHFHSHYSDGLNRVNKIAAQAHKLGIGIAITDHNDIRGALEIEQYTDVLSIPGIEITSAEGSHLLVYFYETKELKRFYESQVRPYMGHGVMSSLMLTMEQIIERVQRYNCLTIFPHPFCAMYTGVCNLQFSQSLLQKLLDMCDGVEVINANNLKRWNLKCTVLGFNLNKAMVGGSDGHNLWHMGRTVSYAPCPNNRSDFLDAVRHKANRVVGKEIDFLRKVTSNGLKLRSNLSNYPDLVEKNLRYGRTAMHSKSRAMYANVQRKFNTYIKPRALKNYFRI